MYCEGRTLRDIAQSVGISHVQVHHDLAVVFKRWRESAVADVAETRSKELAKINHVEREAWEAWNRSVGVDEESTTENFQEEMPIHGRAASDGNRGEHEALESGREEQPLRLMRRAARAWARRHFESGDASYLNVVQWCIDRRIKLLGLDPPKRIDITEHVRALAETLGVDPDVAVTEARRIVAEVEERYDLRSR